MPYQQPAPTAARVAAVVLVCTWALAGCTDAGTPSAAPTTDVTELVVGDCFDDTAGIDGDTVLAIPIIDCADPHDNEVFASWSFDEDAEYPGDDDVQALAEEGCVERFEAYVGVSYASSSLGVFPLFPTFGGWTVGDRLVICAAYAADLAKLESSVRDSGR